jgi:hypothetical protein
MENENSKKQIDVVMSTLYYTLGRNSSMKKIDPNKHPLLLGFIVAKLDDIVTMVDDCHNMRRDKMPELILVEGDGDKLEEEIGKPFSYITIMKSTNKKLVRIYYNRQAMLLQSF